MIPVKPHMKPPQHQPRVLSVNDGTLYKEYKGNYVSTTKYNIVTYFPKALFEQFRQADSSCFCANACPLCTQQADDYLTWSTPAGASPMSTSPLWLPSRARPSVPSGAAAQCRSSQDTCLTADCMLVSAKMWPV